MAGIGGHVSPSPWVRSDDWLTPRGLVSALGSFDLDPCDCRSPLAPIARRSYFVEDDGLSLPWSGRVWLNPPYRTIGDWMERMAEHRNGIALTFARTDTRWFHSSVFGVARSLLFLAGRPTFLRPDGSPGKSNSGGPVVLIAYSGVDSEVLRQSGLRGRFVFLGA